ncbi:MAG TPA: adenylate/guanylate cyclase domain-containing protein [Pseudolabrys sp.]|nr:adenylate/guanylate cyclase domain-containing protein [Pseudolabrys sp.]
MVGIAEWLESIGLGEYAQRFAENAIDRSTLRDLTEHDLKDLGVLLGHRRKLLRAIAELDETIPIAPASPVTKPEREPSDEAERRHLTVMFCDLVGSTALSARLDPEDMRTLIGEYHSRVTEVISRYQGIIARYMGDGVLVYFGYPQAHEDDVEQAVRAGLALVNAVAKLPTDTDATLSARIGIATGTVVVRELLVGETRSEQEVIGQTPNLAARLQTLAEPGTVLICPRTRRLTGGYFDYRDLGPHALKGWAEPIVVWQVLGTSGVESRFDAMHANKLPPLFGREEEIELLLRRWQHATQEEGRVVVLTGEPGIGKSHIAFALDERLQSEPHITLRYFCSAHHTNSALFPFISQLERAAGFKHSDSPAEKLSKLNALVAQSTSDPEDVAVLASLFALPAGDRYSLQDLDPQKRKEKTLAAILAQLDGLSARQPVFMIFEDVHWIDPTSLELLAATVEHVPQLRALLLMTARPDFTPPWPSYSHVTTIPLTRLGRRDGAALVERVTGGKTLPKEVMDQIVAHTDGVPLFIEELTKMVLESGLLRERDGQYVLERPLPPLAIPTTLHASLMARLDRLAPVREVAQIGAVAGRDFHYELLNAVAGLPRQRLDEALNQLVRSELIFRRGEIPHAVYTFKHALVRDAAYAGLLKSRRVHLHAAIADALEQRFPEVVQTQPETLAHHFTEAGLIEKAIGYWLRAGKGAALRSANLEAIAHLKRGIELTGRLPTGEGTDKSELDLQLALGPCLIAAHGPAADDALATFARARELCERLGQPPEYLQVIFWLATASVVRGELPQALEAIAGLPSAAEAHGNQPTLLNVIRGRAMILMFMGRIVEARETLERAAQLFSEIDEAGRTAARTVGQDAGVSILVFMAWVLWILGQADEAVSRMTAALERADVVRHAHTSAYAWYYASVLHALRGEPAIAQSYAERCLAISERHGFHHWFGLSRAIRGICAALLDASAGRVDEVKTSLEEYQRAGYRLGLTAQFVLLCPVLLLRNEPEAALELIDHGLSIVSHNNERFFEAELYRLKASALLMRGASDNDAESFLEQALRTARSQQARSLELRAATDLAGLWMNQGKRAEALDILGSTYGCFMEGFDTPDLKNANTLLAELRS